MASVVSQAAINNNKDENRYDVSSDDDSSHYGDDEKFYDAFDDTVQLLNSLNIGVNTNISDTSLISSSSSSASPNTDNTDGNNHVNESSNNNENNSGIEDAELETEWTFWFDRAMRGTSFNDYEAGLKFIYKVKTVQSFWSVYNNIPDVQTLPIRCTYHLMRNSRKPLWEDAGNANGGIWNFKCNKEDTSTVWRECLLAAIGEQFSDSLAPGDEIVGISASCREKEDIVQIWNLNSQLEPKASILKKLEELVPDVNFTVKFYKPHSLHNAFNNDLNTKKSYPNKQFNQN